MANKSMTIPVALVQNMLIWTGNTPPMALNEFIPTPMRFAPVT